MQCPYCRHPLEPLVIQGRPTGAWQCIKCSGSYLSYQQISGLLEPGGARGAVGLLPAGQAALLSLPPAERGFGQDQGPQPGSSSWQPLGHAPPYTHSTPEAEAPPRRTWWRRKRTESAPPPENPDWDLCTYCGKLHPGTGLNCVHCNVERMRCPQCGMHMVGVRRFQVLVDLCLSCEGLFFEKGRLEALITRLRGEDAGAALGGGAGPAPSLLQQLAAFLEDTEPTGYSLTPPEPKGVFHTMASAVGAGLGSGRRVIYDFLVLLGDLQSPAPGGENKSDPGPRKRRL